MLKVFITAALLGCVAAQQGGQNPYSLSGLDTDAINRIAQQIVFPKPTPPGTNYEGEPQINYNAPQNYNPAPIPNFAAGPVSNYIQNPNYQNPNYNPAPIPNYNAAPINYAQPAAAPTPSFPIGGPAPVQNYNYVPPQQPQRNYVQPQQPQPNYANPQYDQVPFKAGEIDYVYTDPKTGVQHNQIEKSQDGITQGSYTVVDKDGKRRTVSYSADAVNGFRAVVNHGNQQNTIPQGNPIPQQPVAYDPETAKGLAEREEALKKHSRALQRHLKQTAQQQGATHG